MTTQSPFEPDPDRKQADLLRALNDLTAHHVENCAEFANLCRAFHPGGQNAERLEDVPYVPVRLFKNLDLLSVPEADVHRVMRSSGTSGPTSRIYLDRETADHQANVLSSIMTEFLGRRRRPMLIVDTRRVLRGSGGDTARAAAVVGMMRFGGAHHFLLDADGQVDRGALQDWLEKHAGSRIFVFGFTFMIWSHLLPAMEGLGVDLSDATLFHGGGWKKLQDQAVSARTFNHTIEQACGLHDIRNYYGMIEQTGSIYVESGDGILVPPRQADVIVRDPVTMDVLPAGEEGVLQVLSSLPRSYPGHSILTEDLGLRVENPHERERFGPWGIRVTGRLPAAETRGCSDVYAA